MMLSILIILLISFLLVNGIFLIKSYFHKRAIKPSNMDYISIFIALFVSKELVEELLLVSTEANYLIVTLAFGLLFLGNLAIYLAMYSREEVEG